MLSFRHFHLKCLQNRGREQTDRQLFDIHTEDAKLCAFLWSKFECNGSFAKCNRQPQYDWQGWNENSAQLVTLHCATYCIPFLSPVEPFAKFCSNYAYENFRISPPWGTIPSLCWVTTGFQQAINRLIAFLDICMQCRPTLVSHSISADQDCSSNVITARSLNFTIWLYFIT